LSTKKDAIVCLNSLQTPFEVLHERRTAGKKKMDASALTEMISWLEMSGLKVRLNVLY
jgi:hypothetical protein